MKLNPIESFLLGCVAYPALELLTRKRTHPTMALAGGLSAFALSLLANGRGSFLSKSLLGGTLITGIELGIGLLFNRRHRIWDYRRLPLNLKGQICLPFSLLWSGLSYLYLRAVR